MTTPQGDLLNTITNPARVRMDTWMRVQRSTDRLRLLQKSGADTSELAAQVAEGFKELEPLEKYWVFPDNDIFAHLEEQLDHHDFDLLAKNVRLVVRNLREQGDRASLFGDLDELAKMSVDDLLPGKPHYFTVLMVDDIPDQDMEALKEVLRLVQEEDLAYQVLMVDNFEDGLIAALFNSDIQACVMGYDFPLWSDEPSNLMTSFLEQYREMEENEPGVVHRGPALAEVLLEMRPHLNMYLVTGMSTTDPGESTHRIFDRVFTEMDTETHMTILQGVRERFQTPFFDALRAYAAEPIGNFHALPIARGNSVFNSRWIEDMAEFYGPEIFMAETSSTTGGMDSLLAPTGTIKEAQDKAARAWGSQQTFFSTGGTSTSNKIVVQALTRPGDIVLIDRNCHKSHHYGLVLGGAHPLYLDAYPLQPYAIFGAVPLRTIKQQLLQLKKAGRLDKVKMLLLTNCTFDGITYDPRRVMQEVLAIKPDICFLWDEAWYAFANFTPTFRFRTAMCSAAALTERYSSDAYADEYAAYREKMDNLDPEDDSTWLDNRLMPDPDLVRVRVYSTQSTHKSLSSLRQGSMMHIYDQDFARLAEDSFHEAINTHTSTSPNYQIIASLDLARRQAKLEGYGMLNDVYQIALTLRERVDTDPLLSKYFHILTPGELIPPEFRESGLESYTERGSTDLELFVESCEKDEFALDPTRLTLYLAETGYNGNEFKVDVLMDKYGIQVNKTSINSVLLITTIGVNWSSLAYLLDVLKKIAEGIERKLEGAGSAELAIHKKKVDALTSDLPELPTFSHFHPVFRPHPDTPEGDMRSAYFLNYDEENREYIMLDDALEQVRGGRELVSTTFVVPYPPGFPVLVPGQVMSPEILEFMEKLDVKEVHGYRPELGLSAFTEKALEEWGMRAGPAT